MSKYVKLWERLYITDLFSKGSYFGEIKIDNDKCKGCGMCVRFCPGDALMLDANKKPGPNAAIADITGGAQACAACGVCQACCPEEAIQVTKGMMFSGKFKLLRRGPVSMPRLFPELADK